MDIKIRRNFPDGLPFRTRRRANSELLRQDFTLRNDSEDYSWPITRLPLQSQSAWNAAIRLKALHTL
jgi:hypothetical protein